MEQVMVGEEYASVDSVGVRSVLQLRELEERLRQQLYAIHKIINQTKLRLWSTAIVALGREYCGASDRCAARRHSSEGGRPWEL